MLSNKSKKSEKCVFVTTVNTWITEIRTLRILIQSDSNNFYHQAFKDSEV